MSRTISSTFTGPLTLIATDTPLSITGTGSVISSGVGQDGIDGGAGKSWNVINAGLVSAAYGTGISLSGARDSVTNSGSILGGIDGVLLSGRAGSVSNSGGITGASGGIVITGGTTNATGTSRQDNDGGGCGISVTNSSGGSIMGGVGVSVSQTRGMVSNAGQITGTAAYGILFSAGGAVMNQSGGMITAPEFAIKGASSVTNAGTIGSPQTAISVTNGTVVNQAGGVIGGGQYGVVGANRVINDGLITSGGGAVVTQNGRATSVTNNAAGSIVGGNSTPADLAATGVFIAGAAGSVTNAGLISGGVALTDGGVVRNDAGGYITGGPGGFNGITIENAPGKVTNAGKITGTGFYGEGIYLSGGGTIVNNQGGAVFGRIAGIAMGGAGTVTNNTGASISGNIVGIDVVGYAPTAKTSITVVNNAGGTISGNVLGVFLGNGVSGTVTNAGLITSAGIGVSLPEGAGDTVNNKTGGTIAGGYLGAQGTFQTGIVIGSTPGTVTNAGQIIGGVELGDGGRLENKAGGTITASYAAGAAPLYALNVQGAAGSVTNAGQIGGVELAQGGTLTNAAGGVIGGTPTGISAGYGAGGGAPSGFATTIVNAGSIGGTAEAIALASNAANRVVADPGGVFTGGVNGGGGTLEMARGGLGALTGGILGGIGTQFTNFQSVVIDSSASWTLTGANSQGSITNNGTAIIANALNVTGAVDPASSGIFELTAGATMAVAADQAVHSKIDFLGGGGAELTIADASLFGTSTGTTYHGPQIQNFGAGDMIDIANFDPSGLKFAFAQGSGLLTIGDAAKQSAMLSFQTSSLGTGTFNVVGDGANGILITHS